MKIELLADAETVAQEGARIIAAEARAAVATRGRFIAAISGGHTPWLMLRALADQDVPWKALHLVQVDERVTPAESEERNLRHLREAVLDHAPLRPEQVYAMPVESPDLDVGARSYALTLAKNSRFASRARPRPSWSRTRRPHGFFSAGRSCPRSHRPGCCGDRRLSGQTPHDIDISHSQSRSTDSLGRHRKGEKRNAGAIAQR